MRMHLDSNFLSYSREFRDSLCFGHRVKLSYTFPPNGKCDHEANTALGAFLRHP